MNQLFTNYPMIAYAFLGIVLVFAIYLFVKEMQRLGLEKIRKIVYQGFIEAENRFKHGDNERKFEYVVALARENIPAPFNAFISVKLLKAVVPPHPVRGHHPARRSQRDADYRHERQRHPPHRR